MLYLTKPGPGQTKFLPAPSFVSYSKIHRCTCRRPTSTTKVRAIPHETRPRSDKVMTGTWFCEVQHEPSMYLSTPNKYNKGSCYTSRNQSPVITFSQIVRHCIQYGCPPRSTWREDRVCRISRGRHLHAGLKRANTAVKRGQLNSEGIDEQRCVAFIRSRLLDSMRDNDDDDDDDVTKLLIYMRQENHYDVTC